MSKINVAIIGLGNRGKENTKRVLETPDASIVALCDSYIDRVDYMEDFLADKGHKNIFKTTDYKEVLALENVDVVFVFSSWESHIEIAIEAMYAKKAVGLEVGGSYSTEECFNLVKAYEDTKTPFMLLENCCYNKTEMMISAMVKDGLFGEIVHCHGAYAHDLRKEVSTGFEKRHYRLRNYIHRNCENYPTHELGPIAKILNINRGNRMISLVSVASKSAGLREYIKKNIDDLENKDLLNQSFNQGDIVNTIITCANGETISLRLDTTLPRSYSREFTVRGTNGMYEENTNSVFIDGDDEDFDSAKHYYDAFNNAKKYEEKYLPDYWKNITTEQLSSGHGGMDSYLFAEFFKKYKNKEAMPIDVYDAASWMVISALSEQSVSMGGAVVQIPDFTNGKWIMNGSKY